LDWPKFPDSPAPDVVLMIRPVNLSPAAARARHRLAASRVASHVPRTWTRITRSKSAAVMFQMTLSRTIPALFTTTSTWPNAPAARSNSAVTAASSAMSP